MTEQQNTEWKEIWKDEYLQWICGFANAQGGKLYIGINDKGEPVGLKNSAKLLEDLPNKIRDALGIIAEINLLGDASAPYLEIVVPPYPVAISCKGVYYYRSGSTNQKLTGAELESFILRRRGVSWDRMPLPAFGYNDIDDNAVALFKKWATKKGRIDAEALDEPKEVLMERLHLTEAGYLTNAAMLLFSRDPEKWQLGAYTKIGFFASDADLRYQDEIHGSLLEQVDRIMEVVHLKYMKAMISYEGIQRIERYFVPDAALREALLNALCHKDYASGIPIQISVYEDKLYIANCGKLPEPWTAATLFQKHVSKPYNPNVAHVFYLAGLIESWGRGIEKICDACRENGSPMPEYTVNAEDIMVCFPAPADFVTDNNDSIDANDTEDVTVNDTENVTLKIPEEIINQYPEILMLLSNPNLTATELAAALKRDRRTILRHLKILKELGFVKRIGSDKRGQWLIVGEPE